MMSANDNTTYVDSDGNVFHSHSYDAMVTLHGSHFHAIIPMATLVASVLWFTTFVGILVAIIVIRTRAGKDEKACKYLRWPVMGLSTICMILAYAIDIANRTMHEMELTTSQYILTITIAESIMSSAAHTLLISFLLWQLSPSLLLSGNTSHSSAFFVLQMFKALTLFIWILNTADEIVSAILYVERTVRQSSNQKETSASKNPHDVWQAYTDGDVAFNAAFNGCYLVCTLIFAAVAWRALQALRHNNSSLHRNMRIYLPPLTISIVLRSLLDFLWSVVFKFAAHFKTISETLTTQLIHTVIYGLLSVIVYVSILSIASLNDPIRSQVRYGVVQQTQDWQQTEPKMGKGRAMENLDYMGDGSDVAVPGGYYRPEKAAGVQWNHDYPQENTQEINWSR